MRWMSWWVVLPCRFMGRGIRRGMLNASVEQSDAEKTLQDQMLFADQRLSQLMVPRKGLGLFANKNNK
jgi:hypothetical protein